MKKEDNKCDIDIEAQIIESSKKIFINKGYELASMSDIAKDANIGRTTLHYYFRTKSILFDKLICSYADKIFPNIGEIIKDDSTIFDKIPKIVDVYYNLLQQNPDMPIFIINELRRNPQTIINAVSSDKSRVTPIIALHKELNRQMDIGNISKHEIMDILSTFLGVVIFPFVIKTPLSTIFTDDEDYIDRKKNDAINILINYLKPIN